MISSFREKLHQEGVINSAVTTDRPSGENPSPKKPKWGAVALDRVAVIALKLGPLSLLVELTVYSKDLLPH
jgi:hypothetical protein